MLKQSDSSPTAQGRELAPLLAAWIEVLGCTGCKLVNRLEVDGSHDYAFRPSIGETHAAASYRTYDDPDRGKWKHGHLVKDAIVYLCDSHLEIWKEIQEGRLELE